MDHSNPDLVLNFDDYEDLSNFEGHQNSQFFSNLNQYPVTENVQTSQRPGKHPRGDKWDADEDIALMSAYCIASEDEICGKNQKKASLWARVKELYNANQAENPGRLGNRNIAQIKGRYKRLNENANKWVGAYREAYRQIRSGMSMKDVENEAHKIYEASGSKFNDTVVFNEVMCKHPKWDLQLDRNTTRSRPECEVGKEESGDSTKRSRTTEEGDYQVHSNMDTPDSSSSKLKRPIGRDAAKRKGKGKASNEIAEELRAMRITRDSEIDVMKKRLDLDQQKEHKVEERELMKMQLLHLNTLLQKERMSPEEENMKRFLISKFYGN